MVRNPSCHFFRSPLENLFISSLVSTIVQPFAAIPAINQFQIIRGVNMRHHIVVLPLIIMTMCLGCSSMKRSDTARTGREQLLISNAIDQSLGKCDFTAFEGSRVFVEEKYLESVDKAYIISSIRHRLMLNGATLAAKPDDADVVMEMRSGGVGTDNAESYVGIPEIVLPGMLTLPEVRFWQKSKQTALAKIGVLAYDSKNHDMLGAGGVSAAISNDTNVFFMGMGPLQYGTARTELDRTTVRQSGQPNQDLPSLVAFRESKGSSSGRIQQASDESR